MNNKPAKVLIGQKDSKLDALYGPLFNSPRFQVTTIDRGDQIIDRLQSADPPDILLLDTQLSDPDPLEICRTVKANLDLMMIPILIVAADNDSQYQQMAIESGCDDILVPPHIPNVLKARIHSLLRVKFLTDELDSAESVLFTLARTIEAKDRYTLGHADRVANYAVTLGRKMGVKAIDLDVLHKGGMLHDVGKIAIPDAILSKPGKYTSDEFKIMQKHPLLGCDICQKLKSVKDAIPLIRHHHEKLDGSGYPDGLQGDQIPFLVRIVTIVDIYDALRSKRSYKEAFTIDKTFEIMWEEQKKGWWDKDILTHWEQIVRDRDSDSFSA